MVSYVLQRDPTVDTSTLVLTGATDIRNVFNSTQLPIVVEGYLHGLKVVFAMSLAAVGLSTLWSFTTPWKKLDQDKLKNPGGA